MNKERKEAITVVITPDGYVHVSDERDNFDFTKAPEHLSGCGLAIHEGLEWAKKMIGIALIKVDTHSEPFTAGLGLPRIDNYKGLYARQWDEDTEYDDIAHLAGDSSLSED